MKTVIVVEAGGGAFETKVSTGDGREISHLVRSVTWEHSSAMQPVATVELHGVVMKVSAQLGRITDGHGREVRRIVYADGTELSAED